MKNLKTIALMGVALALGACSTCVQERPYNSDPYSPEKTAGSRQAIFGSDCDVKAEPAPVRRTEPVVHEAEPIFRENQQK